MRYEPMPAAPTRVHIGLFSDPREEQQRYLCRGGTVSSAAGFSARETNSNEAAGGASAAIGGH